jgi:hypothetical protein
MKDSVKSRVLGLIIARRRSMKNLRGIIWGAAGLSVFVGALMLMAGCGGSSSPSALADRALQTGTTTEEVQAQEKAILDLTNKPPDEVGVRESLRRVLDKSDKPRIRGQAIDALGNMYDFESGPLVIKALSSEDKYERGRAFVAISKITGSKFTGYIVDSPDAEDRKAGIEEYQKMYDFWKANPDKLEKRMQMLKSGGAAK